MRRAVFLDRDDTLMAANTLPAPAPPAAAGDVVDPRLVRLLPGVREGCAGLKRAGFVLVVVSNQGVVARGGAGLDVVGAVNARLRELLESDEEPGSRRSLIDAVYLCPFHPRGSIARFAREHPWRKPAGGMITAAAEEIGIDLARSWLIGDAARDVEAGVAAGIAPERCLRIGGAAVPDFAAAVAAVLGGAG